MTTTSKRLVTVTLSVDVDGNVYEDTQTHGNSFAEVYQGFLAIREELNRQIAGRRACPFNPKYGSPDPQFED